MSVYISLFTLLLPGMTPKWTTSWQSRSFVCDTREFQESFEVYTYVNTHTDIYVHADTYTHKHKHTCLHADTMGYCRSICKLHYLQSSFPSL